MNLKDYSNFRTFLKDEMERRRSLNAAYSLRAFARDIDISPSRLSELFNKEAFLSVAKAEAIGHKLELGDDHFRYFVDLVILENTTDSLEQELAKERIHIYRSRETSNSINEQDFDAISNWYHLSIIELIRLKDFVPDIDWIALRLGIHRNQVVSTLSKLESLGIIEIKENEISRIHKKNRIRPSTPSAAVRKYHKQILKKAYSAIDEQGVDDRDLSAFTLAIDKKKLPDAKRMLAEFRAKFCEDMDGLSKSPDELYCLSMQLFSLSDQKADEAAPTTNPSRVFTPES